MIQTRISDGRGGFETIDHNDARYWDASYRYEPYPKTLYKARLENRDNPEKVVVRSEDEHRRMGSQWKESPDEANEYLDKLEAEMAAAAAEANYSTSKMSEKAQAEYRAADRATDEFITDVPAPKRGPGRPKRSDA